MDRVPALDDPLATLFTGKRRWPRVPCTRGARLEGPRASYTGTVVNISRGGVLFALEDDAFDREEEDKLQAVERSFPEGPVLVFPTEGIRVPMRVVRITLYEKTRVALGCEFGKELSEVQAALLGVRIARLKHPEAHQAWLPYAMRPEHALSLLVFSEGKDVAGPCCLCEVVAAGTQVLEGRLLAPLVTAEQLAGCLTAHPLRAALVQGRDRPWEGSAHLVEIRVAAEGADATLRFLCASDLGDEVLELFQPRGE